MSKCSYTRRRQPGKRGWVPRKIKHLLINYLHPSHMKLKKYKKIMHPNFFLYDVRSIIDLETSDKNYTYVIFYVYLLIFLNVIIKYIKIV